MKYYKALSGEIYAYDSDAQKKQYNPTLSEMTPEEIEAHLNPILPVTYAELTPRQFWLAALGAGITEDAVDAFIDVLEEPSRSQAIISKKYASSYNRTDPLIASIGANFMLTEEDVNTLWKQAEVL